MRRFAEIDSRNVVLRVIVAESAEWCANVLGGTWIETLKDRSERVHFASAGYTYDEDLDAFIPPQPYHSWVLNGVVWEAPVPMPEDGKEYVWVDALGDWVAVPEPAE